MVLAALFLAIGFILPFFTFNVPGFGGIWLPMHIPVLLCGLILGPKYGFLVGLLLPFTRSFIVGHPPLFPTATVMTFELAAYGLAAGLLYNKLPKTVPFLYASLIGAMLFGRVVWAAARVVVFNLNDVPFSFEIFLTSGFVTALPGIILQIVLIPILIIALKKAGWQRNA